MVLGILGILPAVAVFSAVARATKKLPAKGRDLPKRKKSNNKYKGLAWK